MEAVFDRGYEPLRRDNATDYCNGRFWKLKKSRRRRVDRATRKWAVGIGLAIVKARMPLILFAAKGDEVHRARELAIAICVRIVKDDANGMRIFLVFVEDEERPFPIRA